MSKRKKSPNGSVTVGPCNGRLRITFQCPVEKRRRYLYAGLPESKVNRLVAEQKAALIYRDIEWGEYDPSLKKYKTERQIERDRPTLVNLFDDWIDAKSKSVTARTVAKYKVTRQQLKNCFGLEIKADLVREKDAWQFAEYLESLGIGDTQKKRRIEELKAAYQWSIERQKLNDNPWVIIYRSIKPAPKQPPKPFTFDEISQIIRGFRASSEHGHYGDYVEFLLSTGMRLGECSGLRWKHYNSEFQTIWIGEMMTRGKRRPTKGQKRRSISLTPRLIQILRDRTQGEPDDLIFSTHRGDAIDDGNFRRRHWKPVLTALGIEYRTPKNTRHTMTSHALSLGMAPAEVARLTGNTPRTIHENYEGAIASRPRLPQLTEVSQ